MNKEFAHNFTHEWINAWNSHDLNKIKSHYTIDIEMSSPIITKIINENSGRLKGKEKVRAYWEKALKINPDIHFVAYIILFWC